MIYRIDITTHVYCCTGEQNSVGIIINIYILAQMMSGSNAQTYSGRMEGWGEGTVDIFI